VGNVAVVAGVVVVAVVRNRCHILVTDGCGLWVAKLRVTVVGNVAVVAGVVVVAVVGNVTVVAGVAVVAVVRNRCHILVTDGCGLRVVGCEVAGYGRWKRCSCCRGCNCCRR
jgi:hypothetical protein